MGTLMVALCFLFGLGARGYYEQHTRADRATAFIDMFRSYCLPYAKTGEKPFLGALPKYELMGEYLYLDGAASLLLELGDRSCRVTDVLNPLTAGDRGRLAKQVMQMAMLEFPRLAADHNHGLDNWDEFLLWASPHSAGDPARWGLILSRWSEVPKENETALEVGGPFGDGYPFGSET